MPEIIRIIIKGKTVVYFPVGDTSGICCNKVISKKKALAALVNCRFKNPGRNEHTLYLAVHIIVDYGLQKFLSSIITTFAQLSVVITAIKTETAPDASRKYGFPSFLLLSSQENPPQWQAEGPSLQSCHQCPLSSMVPLHHGRPLHSPPH